MLLIANSISLSTSKEFSLFLDAIKISKEDLDLICPNAHAACWRIRTSFDVRALANAGTAFGSLILPRAIQIFLCNPTLLALLIALFLKIIRNSSSLISNNEIRYSNE